MVDKDREIYVGKNMIYLDENNIINYINIGELDEKAALVSTEAMKKLNKMTNGKANFIIDLNQGNKTSPAARKILKEFTEKEVNGKLAFVGLHPVSRVLASFFMRSTKKKEMKFFNTKDEALNWLKQ